MSQQHPTSQAKSKFGKPRKAALSRRWLQRSLLLEQLEFRRLLNSDWQNPANRLDVDGDSFVSPRDVLLVVNELNKSGNGIADANGKLPVPNGETKPPPFLDVTGDSFVSPLDALIVINVLNLDLAGPVIVVGLLNDTGPNGTNDDLLTFDPTLTGTVTDLSGVRRLEVRVDRGPAIEALVDLNGRFTFDPGLAQDGTDDGLHSVVLIATDARNQTSTPEQFSFTLDTTAPTSTLDLDPAFDTAVIGDHVTAFPLVTIAGQTEPNTAVGIESLGVAVVADASGAFSILNVPLAVGVNTFAALLADPAGNVRNQSERFVRSVSADAFALVEGSPFAVEALKTVTIGDAGTPRQIAINIDTLLDTSAARILLNDVLNVFVVDAIDKNKTLLDNGRPGTPVVSLTEIGANLAAGIVTIRGRELLIDVSTIEANKLQLLFQLVSGDADRNGLIVIDGVHVQTPATAVRAPLLAPIQPEVAPGGVIDLAAFSPAAQLEVRVASPRFGSVAGKFRATLTVTNRGAAVGRDLAVVLRNLPAGVTVANPAAVDNGEPVLNLRPAVGRGGLATGQTSQPVELVIDNPGNTRFVLELDVLAGPPNRAPQLPPIDPITVTPGEVFVRPLVATDADGDPLTFSIAPIAGQPSLPTMRLNANGLLEIRPEPDQLGNVQFLVKVSDGVAAVEQVVVMSVTADPVTTTRISGKVQNTRGEPLAGVPLEIAGFSAVTTADGTFAIALPTLKVPTAAFNISVPAGDPMLDPFNTAT